MNNCINGFHALRLRDVGIIAAVILGGGFPLALADSYLFGPSERVSSLLSAYLALGPDTLTALTMAIFCLVLGLFLAAGDYFLRRFLSPQ